MDASLVEKIESIPVLARAPPEETGSGLNPSGGGSTGIVVDERFLLHATPRGEEHVECPERALRISEKLLNDEAVFRALQRVPARPASDSELLLAHTAEHLERVEGLRKSRARAQQEMELEMASLYANEHTVECARLACGGLIDLVESVVANRVRNGVAVIRPPGHHATSCAPMGFCFYNNVAVAAKAAVKHMGCKKVLIVDWDVHHGNGTQEALYDDPNILFFSVHRHQDGGFYPGGDDGAAVNVGSGSGAGFNVNVSWNNLPGEGWRGRGDFDYMHAWHRVLLPIATEFHPDLVLVSGGFDAARGDPLGGCKITPEGYAHLIHPLMSFAEGKVVVALEGGYNLTSISESALCCAQILVGAGVPSRDDGFTQLEPFPLDATVRDVSATVAALSSHWRCLAYAAVQAPAADGAAAAAFDEHFNVAGVWTGRFLPAGGAPAVPIRASLALSARGVCGSPAVTAAGVVLLSSTGSGAAEASQDLFAGSSGAELLKGSFRADTGLVELSVNGIPLPGQQDVTDSSTEGKKWTGTLSQELGSIWLKGNVLGPQGQLSGQFFLLREEADSTVHTSGLWTGEAVPDASLEPFMIPTNPVCWCLSFLDQSQSVFGCGFFDDAADVPGTPVLFYSLFGSWDATTSKFSLQKRYETSAETEGYFLEYDGELTFSSASNQDTELSGSWKNEHGGSFGTFRCASAVSTSVEPTGEAAPVGEETEDSAARPGTAQSTELENDLKKPFFDPPNSLANSRSASTNVSIDTAGQGLTDEIIKRVADLSLSDQSLKAESDVEITKDRQVEDDNAVVLQDLEEAPVGKVENRADDILASQAENTAAVLQDYGEEPVGDVDTPPQSVQGELSEVQLMLLDLGLRIHLLDDVDPALLKFVEARDAFGLLVEARRIEDSFNRNDFTELRAMMRPPVSVNHVCESLWILLNLTDPGIDSERALMRKVAEYDWKFAKQMLMFPRIMRDVKAFGGLAEITLSEVTANHLLERVFDPAYSPELCNRASRAGGTLSQWLRVEMLRYIVQEATRANPMVKSAAKRRD